MKGGIEVKCEIQEQKIHGVYTISFPHTGNKRKHKITCEYTNGLRNGKYEKKQNNIVLLCFSYTYGEKYGSYLQNFDNVITVIISYLENHPNGTPYVKCKYHNGMKHGEYIEDMKHGVYGIFNKEGNLDTEGSYENDVKQGMHRNIVQEETYKDASSKTVDDR